MLTLIFFALKLDSLSNNTLNHNRIARAKMFVY
jgi:hypothetical protein